VQHIRPEQLRAWLADGAKPCLLDVRESWEFETARIAASTPMPMGEVPGRVSELDPEAEIVVICHHGGRSMQVAGYLEQQGFSKVYNLTGGVDGWARTVDPTMKVY